MEQETNCAMCLETIEQEDKIETLCGHEFHKKCFTTLTIVNKYKICPLCREPFEEDWFRSMKNIFLEFINMEEDEERTRFEADWKWWEDHFRNALQNDQNDDDEWNDFLNPENAAEEWVEGFNPGARPRVSVNPELVVWEGEIEDLFEEAEIMERRSRALEIPPEVFDEIDNFVQRMENRDEDEEN